MTFYDSPHLSSAGPYHLKLCRACGRLLFPYPNRRGDIVYAHSWTAAHDPDPVPLIIPDGFQPTSTHYRWQGKIRCAYCTATGYLSNQHHPRWWGRRHGPNCERHP